SSTMGAKAKKVLDKVYIGNIETDTFPLQKKYFDVILLMDVLEHLFDPLAVLKKLQNYLKDEGIIIITLPNIGNWEIIYNLLRGHFDYKEEGILDEGHLRFFTYDTAKNLIKKAKLETLSIDFVSTMPLVLLKIRNRFPFLGIDKLIRLNYKLFAYQFVFVVR